MNMRFLFMVGVWLSCISFSLADIPSPHKYDQVASREPVKGTVVGADGAPIAGATVRSLSSKHSTTTNEKGEFTLPVADGEKLVISFVGYNDQEVTVNDASLQVTLAVGDSRLNEVVQNLAAQGTGVPPMYNPGYSGTPGSPSGYAQENELQSYFGRVNYNYDNRFLFTASVRADGSTRFGENNKYGYFPSFAAGWNLTREKFMENASLILYACRSVFTQKHDQ